MFTQEALDLVCRVIIQVLPFDGNAIAVSGTAPDSTMQFSTSPARKRQRVETDWQLILRSIGDEKDIEMSIPW